MFRIWVFTKCTTGFLLLNFDSTTCPTFRNTYRSLEPPKKLAVFRRMSEAFCFAHATHYRTGWHDCSSIDFCNSALFSLQVWKYWLLKHSPKNRVQQCVARILARGGGAKSFPKIGFWPISGNDFSYLREWLPLPFYTPGAKKNKYTWLTHFSI